MNARHLKLSLCLLGLLLGGWQTPVLAARTFSISQSPTAVLAEYDMGTTQTLSYTITNTSSGTNICERVYEMRFRLPGTGTVFSSATAAPANWTRTAFSTTSVTFRANTWNDSIDTPVGGGKSCATGQGAVTSVAFNLVLVMRTTTADITETLRDARARYTNDTNFADGITRLASITTNNPGSWTLRALQITSIQTVDATTGLPVSAIYAGTSFKLVITVKNISSTTLNSITANAIPGASCNAGQPTANITGTVTPGVSSTVYSPNPLTLGVGSSGTITLTYTTSASDSGTASFSTYVCNSAKTARSRQATSNTLSVSAFVATLSVLDPGTNLARNCFYINQTLKVRMGWLNNYAFSITGITATLSPSVAGIVTLVSGPTYSTTSIGAGPGTSVPQAVEWVYQITGGTSGQLFGFTGSATGTGSGSPRTTPTASVGNIKRGGYDPVVAPAQTNASSTFQEVDWSLTNNGCGNVQSVSITIPAGFAWNNDGYAVVNTSDDSWSVSGANPVTFSYTGANPIPLGGTGDFYLMLSTPDTTGNYTFDVSVTEDVTGSSTRSTQILVNPFGSTNLNDTSPGPGTWREQYQ